MTTRTRYFVVGSLLVLVAGVCAGLAAYYVGFPMSAFGQSGPKELQYVPRDAAVIAYANVHEVMTSELRQHVRQAVPMQMQENGQRPVVGRPELLLEEGFGDRGAVRMAQ